MHPILISQTQCIKLINDYDRKIDSSFDWSRVINPSGRRKGYNKFYKNLYTFSIKNMVLFKVEVTLCHIFLYFFSV